MYVLALVFMLSSVPAMQVGAETRAVGAVNASIKDAAVAADGLKAENEKEQFMAAAVAKASSTNVKASAQNPLKQFFKYAKNADKKNMKKYASDASLIDGDTYFSDAATKKVGSYVKAENKKRFTYSILSTVVSKDQKSATIKVKVNYRSLYNASSTGTLACLNSWESYYKKHGKDPEDEQLGSIFISSFKKGIKKYPAKETSKTFNVTVKKYGSTWKIAYVSEALLNACFCNVDSGFYRALELYNK